MLAERPIWIMVSRLPVIAPESGRYESPEFPHPRFPAWQLTAHPAPQRPGYQTQDSGGGTETARDPQLRRAALKRLGDSGPHLCGRR